MGCDVLDVVLGVATGGLYTVGKGVWDMVSGGDEKEASNNASDAASALKKMSGQQWAHYRDTYKPLLTGLVKESQKDEYAGKIEGSIASAAKQNQAVGDSAIISGGARRGLDPTQMAVSSNLASLGGITGAKTGQTLASVRPSLETAGWNKRMGMVQVGRGMPGQIQSGYANLASQYANTAASEAAKTQANRNSVSQLAGLGLGLIM